MTVTKVFATKTSRGDNRKISGLVGISEADLSKARVVLHHAPDLADNVRAGHLSLDNAYEEARVRKGQRAMMMAKIYPEPKRGVHSEFRNGTGEFSKAYLSYARTVLRHASDLADSVLAGSLSLDNAYEEGRIRKGQADTYEARFQSLKAAAPDLADLVVDGQQARAWPQARNVKNLPGLFPMKLPFTLTCPPGFTC